MRFSKYKNCLDHFSLGGFVLITSIETDTNVRLTHHVSASIDVVLLVYVVYKQVNT